MNALDYWRLCDELTIIQAALLISGQDPGDYSNIENWDNRDRPEGYEAVKHALVAAVRTRRIKCRIITNFEVIHVDRDKSMGEAYLEPLPETVDIERSFLDVEALRKWLMQKGITEGFFFPPNLPKIDFLNPSHPRYAPKLAAAVNAWRATPHGDYLKNKSPKQGLMKWLNGKHAVRTAVSLTPLVSA